MTPGSRKTADSQTKQTAPREEAEREGHDPTIKILWMDDRAWPVRACYLGFLFLQVAHLGLVTPLLAKTGKEIAIEDELCVALH
jgi:hypothetical protein